MRKTSSYKLNEITQARAQMSKTRLALKVMGIGQLATIAITLKPARCAKSLIPTMTEEE
jgi:hypothetical protein